MTRAPQRSHPIYPLLMPSDVRVAEYIGACPTTLHTAALQVTLHHSKRTCRTVSLLSQTREQWVLAPGYWSSLWNYDTWTMGFSEWGMVTNVTAQSWVLARGLWSKLWNYDTRRLGFSSIPLVEAMELWQNLLGFKHGRTGQALWHFNLGYEHSFFSQDLGQRVFGF